MRATPRPAPAGPEAPCGFREAGRDEAPSLMIKRVGASSGKVERYRFIPDAANSQRRNHNWFYVIPDSDKTEEAIRRAEADMRAHRAGITGPRSISRRDMVAAINRHTRHVINP